MKEITIRIPDDSSELVTELVEKSGGSIDKKERINTGVIKSAKNKKNNSNSSNKKKGGPLALFSKSPDSPLERGDRKQKKEAMQSPRKTKKEKIDDTYLFGKWKDFDIDTEKLREEVWRRD